MMKPLAAAAAVLCLVACAPAPPPGDSPVSTVVPPRPAAPATKESVEAEELEPLPADAYLRLRATAHPVSGGSLDLVLTVFEPTIEAETAAATIDAIADGCFLYDDNRALLDERAGVDHYFSVAQLEVTGDGAFTAAGLTVAGLESVAGTQTGPAVLDDEWDCHAYVVGAGSATLYGYFSTFGADDLSMMLEWQTPGFSDINGVAATNVSFDNCSVQYSDHARSLVGGYYDWSLRDEGWRCAVAAAEPE